MFDPKDNPLKDVKVKIPNDREEFDPARIVYRLFHGTDEGYRKAPKLNNQNTDYQHKLKS